MATRFIHLACLLGSACALTPAAEAPPSPKPTRLALNRACESCHTDVAAEWRGSLHQRAYVDPVFQEALAIEPLPFCRGCHAPEADPTRPAPAPLAELGVACVSCHLVEDAVLAAAEGKGSHVGTDAPPLRRTEDFSSPQACANCHQFAFPETETTELMQSTVREHAASPFAEASCATCHMPAAGSRRSHAFARSRRRTAAALKVSVRLEDELVLTLKPRGVGHAFPTGDLFRRLRLEAEGFGPDMNVTGQARRYLARHFATDPRGGSGVLGRYLRRDDRPGGAEHGFGPLDVRLDVGPATEVRWRVVYERVAHPAPGGAPAVVADEVVVAEGVSRR